MGVWLGLCVLLFSGCSMMRGRTSLPDAVNVERDQLILHSDFRLSRQHRLVEELVELRQEIAQELNLPMSDEPIHIYLFESTRDFEGYIKQQHSDLPDRRAYFIETDTRLNVYAHWGDRVAEDLRHELAHGYLHAATKHLPLWLDEGLAEYYELPQDQNGLHIPHIQLLAQAIVEAAWRPNLARIESLADVHEFTQIDYAEAWLWSHFLLKTTRERHLLLQDHLKMLTERTSSTPVSSTLLRSEPEAEMAILEHLNMLHRQAVQQAQSTPRESTFSP